MTDMKPNRDHHPEGTTMLGRFGTEGGRIVEATVDEWTAAGFLRLLIGRGDSQYWYWIDPNHDDFTVVEVLSRSDGKQVVRHGA